MKFDRTNILLLPLVAYATDIQGRGEVITPNCLFGSLDPMMDNADKTPG